MESWSRQATERETTHLPLGERPTAYPPGIDGPGPGFSGDLLVRVTVTSADTDAGLPMAEPAPVPKKRATACNAKQARSVHADELPVVSRMAIATGMSDDPGWLGVHGPRITAGYGPRRTDRGIGRHRHLPGSEPPAGGTANRGRPGQPGERPEHRTQGLEHLAGAAGRTRRSARGDRRRRPGRWRTDRDSTRDRPEHPRSVRGSGQPADGSRSAHDPKSIGGNSELDRRGEPAGRSAGDGPQPGPPTAETIAGT